MIRRIEIKGFRCLKYVSVDLEPFQILVGPNGSGKSTFFDAINLLRDILNVGIEKAVFGDLRSQLPQRAPDPRDLTWMRKGDDIEIALTAELPQGANSPASNGYRFCRYEIALAMLPDLALRNENLWLCKDLPSATPRELELFPADSDATKSVVLSQRKRIPSGWRMVVRKNGDTGTDYFKSESSDWNNQFRIGPSKAALANLPADQEKFPVATWFKEFLMESVQRLMLDAESMRKPCPAGLSSSFLPNGSNIARVINTIENNTSEALADWISHIRTCLPDLESVMTKEREEDRSRYLILRHGSGLEAPSWLLSDGTLRLLALTLLAYTRDTPRLVVVEEPENGIHPQAVETVFQSLSSVRDRQVFLATHSPVVLSLARPEQVLCFGRTQDGATDIIRGDRHPRLREWRDGGPLGDLFAAGVLS